MSTMRYEVQTMVEPLEAIHGPQDSRCMHHSGSSQNAFTPYSMQSPNTSPPPYRNAPWPAVQHPFAASRCRQGTHPAMEATGAIPLVGLQASGSVTECARLRLQAHPGASLTVPKGRGGRPAHRARHCFARKTAWMQRDTAVCVVWPRHICVVCSMLGGCNAPGPGQV